MTRLPFTPIASYLRLHWDAPIYSPSDHPGSDEHHGMWSNAQCGDLLGVSARQIRKWITNGVDTTQADHIANKLGLHPNDLWGRDWWRTANEATSRCGSQSGVSRHRRKGEKACVACRAFDAKRKRERRQAA